MDWKKLHNEELMDLHLSPNIRVINWRRVRWAGRGKVHTVFWLRRLRESWEDNIKMDVQEVGFGGMDWIVLAQIGTGGVLL